MFIVADLVSLTMDVILPSIHPCFNQNFAVPFKGVLDYDLQPHPGARTLGPEVMMWMQTLQGNYGPNLNAFWWVDMEIYTTSWLEKL